MISTRFLHILKFLILITAGKNHIAKQRLKSWLIYFVPLITICILMFVLDITATTYYGLDFAMSLVSIFFVVQESIQTLIPIRALKVQ